MNNDPLLHNALKECQTLFRKFGEGCDTEEKRCFYGHYPLCAIIILLNGDTSDPPSSCWYLERNTLTPLSAARARLPSGDCSGMYYSQAGFTIRISQDRQKVFIDMVLGAALWPRFFLRVFGQRTVRPKNRMGILEKPVCRNNRHNGFFFTPAAHIWLGIR